MVMAVLVMVAVIMIVVMMVAIVRVTMIIRADAAHVVVMALLDFADIALIADHLFAVFA
jgi:hypothetical protein